MPSTNTPLRYPGGKSRLYRFVSELLTRNSLTSCTYVEPFAGGAGLAMSLLLRGNVSRAVINDLDFTVYAFWRCVLDRTQDLVDAIQTVPVTIAEWERQREIQQHPDHYSILEVALSTLFLNRTNRSGILKGGVIGGKKQAGAYSLSCRFNKTTLVSKTRRIAALRDRISLYNLDVREFIPQVTNGMNRHTLVYLDPPYIAKGCDLYCNYFTKHDHRDLGNLVKSLAIPWILTYDAEPLVYDIYGGFRISEVTLSYTAGSRRLGRELIVYSSDLQPPDMDRGIIVI